MDKVNVKIVVGANYGDEGKGLATNFFAKNSSGKTLNVLYNGGAQRGHTVEFESGQRHIFHHFGSGTFYGTDTFFGKDFIVNPIIFSEEYQELNGSINCFVSPECRVTNPYDMFINQIVEIFRGENKHGSCGCGIWETQRRYSEGKYPLRYKDMVQMTDADVFEYIKSIAENYFKKQMEFYGIKDIPEEYKPLIDNETIIIHYINDFRFMQRKCEIKEFEEICNEYKTIIFEAGQGLALSEKNVSCSPHTTPSDTGSFVPANMVKKLNADVEICYITRSYFTRHGVGPFETECEKEKICKIISDKTNVRNDFQDSIRYGTFSKLEFLYRVLLDFMEARSVIPSVKKSLMVTHLNYTNGDIFGDCKIKDLRKYFDKVYRSYTKYLGGVI